MNNQMTLSVPGLQKHKIVFLGQSGVGKTSIIERIIYGSFDDRKQQTIAIDFLKKDLIEDNTLHRLLLWDTAGQQKYHSLIKSYIKQAECVILVYNASEDQAYRYCERWLQFIQSHENQCKVIAVGNKTDLVIGIKKEEVRKYFAQKNINTVLNISAKTGEGIDKLTKIILQESIKIKESESTKESDASTLKKNVSVINPKIQYKFSQPAKCCQI